MRTLASRRSLGLLLGFGLLAPAPARAAEPGPEPGLIKEVLADGIYLFRAPSALDLWTATNVVVIVNDEDVTVFDSFTRAGTARLLIDEIKKLTPKPVRTLINSHWHQDHWSGNAEFAKAFPGLRIVATTESRDYMRRTGSKFFAKSIERGLAISRAALDSAVKTGKQADGKPLTKDARDTIERDTAETASFAREVAASPRVYPNVAFRDTLVLWSGNREFRLISETGDASASTVLYLPRERMLVTGDVLVAQESGEGPPPWTTNSYQISPWVTTLRSLATLDLGVIVPGQGLAFHDKTYLNLTIDLFQGVIDQVHAALERGVVGLEAVQAAVNVDGLGQRYRADSPLPAPFHDWVGTLVRKVYQESLDGASR